MSCVSGCECYGIDFVLGVEGDGSPAVDICTALVLLMLCKFGVRRVERRRLGHPKGVHVL